MRKRFMSRIKKNLAYNLDIHFVNRFFNKRKFVIREKYETEKLNIVAFSLYGNDPRYLRGGLLNIEHYAYWFPEFVCRFYVASDVGSKVIDDLLHKGAEVFIMDAKGFDVTYRFWRFMASEDMKKDRFLIRDIDSAASMRERGLYNKWVESGKTYNVIRDHFSHNVRIMAGMWGGKTARLFFTKSLHYLWRYSSQWDRDQNFLSEIIYPRISKDLFVQDIIHRFPDENPSINEIDIINFSFVGEIATNDEELKNWRSAFRDLYIKNRSLIRDMS